MEQDNTATAAPVVDNGRPITVPAAENSKQSSGKGWKIAAVIASVVAVCGIGFGVYGMGWFSGVSDGSQTTNNEPEIQGLNEYEIRDLSEKTLRLLGDRNGLSRRDYYDSNTGDFMIYSGYMPIAGLMANSLDEASKAYITLETTKLDKEKDCSYQWTDGVKADIDAALGQRASNFSFGNAYIDCISYDKANDDHYELWGESMPKMNGMSNTITNGDFAYGSNLDAYYYHIVGGRGGLCSDYIVGRIARVGKNQDFAYVDVDAGTFYACRGDAGELYSDIEKGELYKTIEPDNTDWDGSDLTEDDYDSFESYRFVFKKNSDDIYYFSNVEKL